MTAPAASLREDALAIWRAGLNAVRSDRLVQAAVRVDASQLLIGQHAMPLAQIGRILVVGCGKAGAGMAAGLEAALGSSLLAEKRLTGWINVPDDCVRALDRIHLHPARPPGVNEPTAAGAAGAAKILEMVSAADERDLVFALISGGGSALLPAPVEGITLEDKLAVTRHLSAAGANIQQLNTVRKRLSRIKGGGLARACRARWLFALIISDVLGDPLDVIASGPTVPDSATPGEALALLERFEARQAGISDRVFDYLQHAATAGDRRGGVATGCDVANIVIGNLATAVNASRKEAQRRGYATESVALQELEGEAEQVGRQLANRAMAMKRSGGRRCWISGGEPTVRLVERSRRGTGGRNQQLVLAALQRFREIGEAGHRVALLSGGTDGEDGPTDAAGAVLDAEICAAAARAELDAGEYLARNDAYHFFQPLGALIHTGPTHTNVCDVRVAVTDDH